VLEFELGTSCLLGRHSILFAQVILEIGSRFLPVLAWAMILLFYYHCEVPGGHHHAQLFPLKNGALPTFFFFFARAGLQLQSF
jgi:hypothetical protein